MANWDEDDFVTVLPSIKEGHPKGLWDDEDAEEEDVKESWEDEDDDTTMASEKEPIPEKKDESKSSNLDSDIKGNALEAKTTIFADYVLVDPVVEKLRQQRFLEEVDNKFQTELFPVGDNEKSVDNFIPKSEHDFMEYAELLAHKLRHYEKSYHYILLLKAVLRLSMAPLRAADAKEIAISVTALVNEKLKEEKEANAGKKMQGVKKQQLHVDKPDDDVVSATYDDVGDDYDFI